MEVKTSIANAIEKTEGRAKYGKQVKGLFADKSILAHILKNCVGELASLTIDEIKACICGEVAIGSERIEGRQIQSSR